MWAIEQGEQWVVLYTRSSFLKETSAGNGGLLLIINLCSINIGSAIS